MGDDGATSPSGTAWGALVTLLVQRAHHAWRAAAYLAGVGA